MYDYLFVTKLRKKVLGHSLDKKICNYNFCKNVTSEWKFHVAIDMLPFIKHEENILEVDFVIIYIMYRTIFLFRFSLDCFEI